MATRKKKKEEDEKKPVKKRKTTRKTSRAKKKEEAPVEPREQQDVSMPEEEVQVESSVPPDFFEHQEEVSSSFAKPQEETESEDVAPVEDEVTEPGPVGYTKEHDTQTVQEKIDTHVAELNHVLTQDTEESAVHTRPIESTRPHSRQSRWPSVTCYLLLVIAIVVGAYVVLGHIFSATLSYEFVGTRTPVSIPEEVTVSQEMLEVLSTPTGYLRVRSGPGTSHDEVAKVFPGDQFVVLTHDDEWIEIQIDEDLDGWVFAQYVEILSQ